MKKYIGKLINKKMNMQAKANICFVRKMNILFWGKNGVLQFECGWSIYI